MAIASGRYHALAIGRHSQLVYSWGMNDHGQLGRAGVAERAAGRRACERGGRGRDGTPQPVRSPLPADGLKARALAAGRYFSLALGLDGRVYAWGRCGCGRDAAVESEGALMAGSQVYALRGGGIEGERAVAIAAGYSHIMALTTSNALYTCESGDDGYGGRLTRVAESHGQLGRPGAALTPLRVPVDAFSPQYPLRLIAAGRCASFAVDASGATYAWGCAQATGHPPPDAHAPRRLALLNGKRVVALAAGEYHALAAPTDGRILAWGAGAPSPSGGAVEVSGLPAHTGSDVLALAAGYQHSLVSLSVCGRAAVSEL